MKIIIIGGGAAGFFSALAAKALNLSAEVLILESSSNLLNKVRLSGGGRCNVTNACFDPHLLIKNYPRGSKELLGPFHKFQPLDVIEWFKSRKVNLKKEADGRVFPISNSSETIINCFLEEAKKLGIKILTQMKLKDIKKNNDCFELNVGTEPSLLANRLIFATGSSQSGMEFVKKLGHTIKTPVPSLFTFNIPAFPLSRISGVSLNNVKIRLKDSIFEQTGQLLITHWGFSGSAILKLSSWCARFIAEKNYIGNLLIDWIPEISADKLNHMIKVEQVTHPYKHLGNLRFTSIPKSLWNMLCERAGLHSNLSLKKLIKKDISKLSYLLKNDCYEIKGKSASKSEFVTCGGIVLSEVNFKTMESKRRENIFFCGEILNIDGITGGFNFQNAWTTGWIAGRAAAI